MDINLGDSQQTTLAFALLISFFIVVGGAIACPLSVARGTSTVNAN